MTVKFFIVAAFVLSSVAHADTDFRLLIKAAIDAPDGRAEAIVEGKLSRAIQQAIGTSAPVVAEVRTLKSWREPGCRRLAVRLSTPQFKMKTSTGESEPFGVEYQLNVCRDGRPPAEAIDWSKVHTGALDRPLGQEAPR